ncbi:S41 family peptidase [Candidatus Peregrinibacteria bacterium]|nr:S41 family peptidase [Candidatus Peregrinibacteria bacterium]
MNTPQKFFGFLLLPILTFILGVALSGEIYQNKRPKIYLPQEPIVSEAQKIDTQIFWTALQRWEESAEPSEKGAVEKFRTTIEKTIDILENTQKVDLSKLWEALQVVENEYVDPEKVNANTLSEWLVRGLISSLEDDYSSYMSREESQTFDEELAGELEGIGAELTMRNSLVTVVSPLRNSPAEQAGIFPEDVIATVDGESVDGMTLLEVVNKIRGKNGTKVVLGILRKTETNILDIEITRKHIVVESVKLEMKNGIAVLEVSQFGDHTKEEFEKYLREAIAGNPRGIVLDLRFNPGGYLDSAVDMVSFFVKEGKVVIQKERAPTITNRFVNGRVLTDLPLVVLINGGSASAAEIVAGALRDHNRAILIGETSFGKGTVQEIVPMSDGAKLRLTVAKWLTPNGLDISKKGIEPDIALKREISDFETNKDPQMEAALKILRREAKPEDFENVSENAKKLFPGEASILPK